MVVIEQICGIWSKLVVFGHSGCIQSKWLYSYKRVVFGISVFGQKKL